MGLWIIRTAVLAFIENLNYLTGHGAPKQLMNELKDEIEAVPGVISVHQLYAEYVGSKLRLDVHIDLEDTMPLKQVHAIETELENRMGLRPEVDHVFIHAEPVSENPDSN